MSTLEEVLREAYKLVTPSEEEERELKKVTEKVKALIADAINKYGIEAEIGVYGSSARSTWLPGQRDIDIFIVLTNRNINIKDVITLLSRYFSERGVTWSMRYAQHPYLSLLVDGYEVDVVPCYKISFGERPITAADRTPLHHKFLVEKLSEEQRRDVRLLKLFMKTIGVYGAEIKVEGFSGYLTELLVAYYGSFIDVLKAASRWRPYRTYITFSESRAKFKAPLVVVDPVDPERNVAAAVSLTSMSTFILASRRFLKNPSITYFQQRQGAVIKTNVVEVVFPYPNEPPDIVWGRYKRIGRSVFNWLKQCGFRVYRWGVESDEKSYVSLIYVVEQIELPPYMLHRGPPVYDGAVDAFVEKYLDKDIIGPFVQGSRVYVIKRRRYTNISDCLKTYLGKGDYTIRINLYEGALVRKNAWIT
ncbi:tRNA adenylyltransferase [Pyrobaculum islandicum DSM 4184]|uniref:CCA-adding enzyme n=1 Tax=Pyrobaculum islandicum (strain DSM 4184 / JCM 9189 / GEO3) TaxID=384616 RepID=CCA_PYRIL|nr:CCA tRNA nucleotidyltransferase [Pyrobaculum islandicum]A1RS16.1 RecName: Full=CCA-adding enzyme; AltName: Full=CCA tRNA nucleotidyltransferase; AltName: Full=tRNA CCA-pyrophosphorylase; AltName: Full=tRNA adenylyl-/cytidylyl- transferase; AltName: Full=tRNA nucleotidyltransferase; AltName: Full=tRNA-NT [Pyrobaculum islandicum DSM 4184]ABL87748.1 tRNA adenylyltransferase [Pyrobaculum islandicum DSM 4184]